MMDIRQSPYYNGLVIAKTYDYAILGDHRPEGLFVAAALARKGLSVALVPSSSVGEKQLNHSASWIFPNRMGAYQSTDLFFRAGFFRLEDAHLQATRWRHQIILPRHRMTLNGSLENRLKETEREFPHAWSAMSHLVQLKKDRLQRAFQKALHHLSEIVERDVDIQRWMLLELEEPPAAPSSHNLRTLTQRWIQESLSEDEKYLEVTHLEGQSYSEFLADNARKWGVEVLDGDLDIKRGFRGYSLEKTRRAQRLILNSWGLTRRLEKSWGERLSPDIQYWLYEDRLQVMEADLPEPLGESLVLAHPRMARVVRIKRHPRQKTATLVLGTWLRCGDSKSWTMDIAESRKIFKGFMPFLSDDLFMTIPSVLELTEEEGDLVRRGLVSRLKSVPPPETRWQRFTRRWVGGTEAGIMLPRRVRALHPLLLSRKSRYESFCQAFRVIAEAEKGRKRSSNRGAPL